MASQIKAYWYELCVTLRCLQAISGRCWAETTVGSLTPLVCSGMSAGDTYPFATSSKSSTNLGPDYWWWLLCQPISECSEVSHQIWIELKQLWVAWHLDVLQLAKCIRAFSHRFGATNDSAMGVIFILFLHLTRLLQICGSRWMPSLPFQVTSDCLESASRFGLGRNCCVAGDTVPWECFTVNAVPFCIYQVTNRCGSWWMTILWAYNVWPCFCLNTCFSS